ncbi:translocator protein-like isoform X2 [Xenopus tropicalis]|nr:translocator protein-like isoform X2 [Xenopus tropicalis]
MPSWAPAIGLTLFPQVGAIAARFITEREVETWFKTLVKPSWCPPNWMFGPVWGTLFTSMGYGSYLIYKELGGLNENAVVPLGLYASQLALVWAWTPIVFGAHKIGWGLVHILLLWGAAAAATTASWFPISRPAAYLMLPYLAWLTLASALNYRFWRDNKDKSE